MEIKSPFTLGLLVFSAFLLVHNTLAVYHYFTLMSDTAVPGDNLLLVEAILQMAASSALVYATMR